MTSSRTRGPVDLGHCSMLETGRKAFSNEDKRAAIEQAIREQLRIVERSLRRIPAFAKGIQLPQLEEEHEC